MPWHHPGNAVSAGTASGCIHVGHGFVTIPVSFQDTEKTSGKIRPKRAPFSAARAGRTRFIRWPVRRREKVRKMTGKMRITVILADNNCSLAVACSHQGTCLEKTNVFECSLPAVLKDMVEYDRGRDGQKEPRPGKKREMRNLLFFIRARGSHWGFGIH